MHAFCLGICKTQYSNLLVLYLLFPLGIVCTGKAKQQASLH